MDCSLLGSSVHGILQAWILEWAATAFSRGSSQPRDWIQITCTVDGILYHLSRQGSYANQHVHCLGTSMGAGGGGACGGPGASRDSHAEPMGEASAEPSSRAGSRRKDAMVVRPAWGTDDWAVWKMTQGSPWLPPTHHIPSREGTYLIPASPTLARNMNYPPYRHLLFLLINFKVQLWHNFQTGGGGV